ncbi:hypothetical protein FPZ43_02725 [Mucilaginibacter pallidiroseus]|uniref:PDZ domain-containing protein n=1 Tax=Mucilaginibacter pallidiroseus TaxID=2599295 RepID=A0A563UJC2_9SPHI|nr:S41 family peptidase [Mucilaginibacter pallidiroseus]TWR31409.1 hypothetical protein FPZ43_02725 [Mucilaginibacter pallidiroseus]
MRKSLYFLSFVMLLGAVACKKSKTPTPDEDNTTTGPSKTGSTLDLMRDSVYLYAKETYYWNTAIPDYATFKPRSYTGSNDLDALQAEIDAISQLQINPDTKRPYEYSPNDVGHAKYSFIDEGEVAANLSAVKGDFGFAPIWITTTDLRVRYVYPGSPADQAGLKRGYQITKINDRTSLNYDGDSSNPTTVNFVINAYANSSNITMTVKRPDGTSFDVNMNVASYATNPVLKTSVINTANGHKVGYIVFNSFTEPDNAKPKLNEAFATFSAAGITDLVVDLRYNSGGYVSTAEYLTNLIAPASASGQLMYNTYFNSTLASGKAVLLKNQVRKNNGTTYSLGQLDYSVEGNATNFSKTNVPYTFSLGNVFFIVTGSTASASELTINNLRGVMDNVKLIGTTTYGKPVGFFDIDINKYKMYIAQFETKNKKGEGGYYSGMTPTSANVPTNYAGVRDGDDVSKDFGDPTERLLAHALNFVNTGSYSTTGGQQIQSLSNAPGTFSIDEQRAAAIQLDGKRFNGMIFDNLKKK